MNDGIALGTVFGGFGILFVFFSIVESAERAKKFLGVVGLILFVAAFVSAAFGYKTVRGTPATSLDPGVYEIYNVRYAEDAYYLHLAPIESFTNGVPQIGEDRLVRINTESVDPAALPSVGRATVITVTVCEAAKNGCSERLNFTMAWSDPCPPYWMEHMAYGYPCVLPMSPDTPTAMR